jgi:hypothetical protein
VGLFSSKKTIQVSSVVYNLAGDIDKRPDYLKTTVLGSVLSKNTASSMGEKLTGSYLNGPGMQLRRFPGWARRTGFANFMGVPSGTVTLAATIDKVALTGMLPHAAGTSVILQTAEIGPPDYSYWVARYMVLNHPTLLETDYTSDFDTSTGSILVRLAGGAQESFTPSDYVADVRYLYATYSETSPGSL